MAFLSPPPGKLQSSTSNKPQPHLAFFLLIFKKYQRTFICHATDIRHIFIEIKIIQGHRKQSFSIAVSIVAVQPSALTGQKTPFLCCCLRAVS
jgi:hypothetical protein